MAGYRAGKASWTQEGFYPVSERLGAGLKKEADTVLLVDVGGGMGHDLEDLKTRFPDLKGRLLLQERPEVIRQIASLSTGIEVIEHDFFTTQPVKGPFSPLFPMPRSTHIPSLPVQVRARTTCTPSCTTGTTTRLAESLRTWLPLWSGVTPSCSSTSWSFQTRPRRGRSRAWTG